MTRFRVIALLIICALSVACAKVPVTGRRQAAAVPESVMVPLGTTTYQAMLGEMSVVRRGDDAQIINQAGRRVARNAHRGTEDWEFTLLRDDSVNAWALPGGKVGVHTGLLPVARNEAALAFVLAHEVAHVVARHGAERLTQQLALVGGMAGLNLYLRDRTELTEEQRAMIMAALGVGAQVGVLLPYSRLHESEADAIGLMYMARAGYPPEESIELWERMEQAAGAQPPEFLSSHPSHDRRAEVLREWMPRAERRYQRNKLDRETTGTVWR